MILVRAPEGRPSWAGRLHPARGRASGSGRKKKLPTPCLHHGAVSAGRSGKAHTLPPVGRSAPLLRETALVGLQQGCCGSTDERAFDELVKQTDPQAPL